MIKGVELWCYLFLSCCLYSCSLTRKKDLLQQKQESYLETSAEEKRIEKANVKKSIVTIDSKTSNFSMLIKPIGRFNYTEQYGFIGNAEYILLKGKSSTSQQMLITEKINAESSNAKKTEQVQKNKAVMTKRMLVSKKNLPILLYPLLALLLIWMVYLLVKKVKAYI